jgi:hypothetical protein
MRVTLYEKDGVRTLEVTAEMQTREEVERLIDALETFIIFLAEPRGEQS